METIAKMTIGELLGSSAGIFLLLSLFIEITPIKLSPISTFLSWLGKKMTGALANDVVELGVKVDAIGEKVDNNETDRIRYEILEFANSCQNTRKHTKEEFNHVIGLHTKYMAMLDEKHKTNGQIDIAFSYIADLYRNYLENNSFL